MNVTVEGTLFLVDLDTLVVTICTWQGEEAKLPISHLCAFVEHLRSSSVSLPAQLPRATSA
jgi:hypothetical protein